LPPVQKKTLAVIDDDPGMRRALQRVLSTLGYAVYTYESAEAFLAVAAASTADCLVVDIQLRDISGVELCRQLTATGFGFPTIFMTNIDDDIIRNQAMQLGCAAYLTKPFSADLLIDAIVRAVG
jgi:FixJ family two-component response regulator